MRARQLYSELQPLLTLNIPEGWERVLIHDGHIVFGVRFYYTGKRRDSIDISYWEDSQRYQTWVYGSTDQQYSTLPEAIERTRLLMRMVEEAVHWLNIANIRSEEYGMRLLDRHGIGRDTITLLATAFRTLQEFLCASIDDLEAISGIGSDKAWLIADHLCPNVRYNKLWDSNEKRWIDFYQVPKWIIEQCVETRTHLTQSTRNKYRMTHGEIKTRGLIKTRERECVKHSVTSYKPRKKDIEVKEEDE